MKNQYLRTTSGVVTLLVGFLIFPVVAQQSATPAKPAQGGPSPSATAGTAATPGPDKSPQRVVLKVGDTQVTQSEMDALVSELGVRAKVMVANHGRRPLGEEYMKMLLLSRRALDEHLDASPAIRSQLERQRAQTLAEAQYEKMSREIKPSQEEISQYFAGHRSEFETVKVREFTIRKRAPGSNDPKQGLTPEAAKAKAESIRKALLAGTDIKKVEETYGSLPDVMLVDRTVRTLRRNEMSPALEKATFVLQAGGVSEPVDTPQVMYVVKVFGHDYPELKDVAEEIESNLRQQKLDAEIDEMKKKAGVWMDDDYFNAKPPVKAASGAQGPISAQTPKP